VGDNARAPEENEIVLEATRHQVDHFRVSDPRCRVMQLPEGILLRYTLSQALYFYLRTGAADGKIVTRVSASDSPYDPKKTGIGEAATPMFEPDADARHPQKVQRLLQSWIEFVKDDPDTDATFTSFRLGKGVLPPFWCMVVARPSEEPRKTYNVKGSYPARS
jgi:hypothetical protein